MQEWWWCSVGLVKKKLKPKLSFPSLTSELYTDYPLENLVDPLCTVASKSDKLTTEAYYKLTINTNQVLRSFYNSSGTLIRTSVFISTSYTIKSIAYDDGYVVILHDKGVIFTKMNGVIVYSYTPVDIKNIPYAVTAIKLINNVLVIQNQDRNFVFLTLDHTLLLTEKSDYFLSIMYTVTKSDVIIYHQTGSNTTGDIKHYSIVDNTTKLIKKSSTFNVPTSAIPYTLLYKKYESEVL